MTQREKLPNLDVSAELHRLMLTIRVAEQRIAEIYPTDKIQSPIHLSIGQEAVSAGVCRALKVTDHLYGTYRGHGVFISKGGDLRKMFAELYGKVDGCCRGKGGSMHLVAPEVGLMGCSAIVASTVPVAVGAALAARMQRNQRVVVALFGDGATDEGVVHESLNFAALKHLPIVFVCENNGLAVHAKLVDRHKQPELYRLGDGVGVVGQRHDGNDVSVVYETMRAAVEDVRNGGAPILIEYLTCRAREHVGPRNDVAAPYRDAADARVAVEQDPLQLSELRLRNQFQVTDAQLREWETGVRQRVEEAIAFAEASPYPAAASLYEDMYGEPQ